MLAQRKNAAVEVDKTIARNVLFITTYALSVVPAIWLLREIIRNLNAAIKNKFRINLTVICKAILLCGILSAHIVSWIGFRDGIVSGKRCMTLFLYDLFLVDLCFYLKTSREAFADAVRCLSVIIWISALYGVFEHFAGDRIPHLYTQTYGDRISSVYSNPIPAGSIWLMGFWLPSPINNRWLDRAYRLIYLAAIIFTISKNAWIGLGFSLLVYFWQTGKRFELNRASRNKAFLVIGIVVCAVVAAIVKGSAFWNVILQRWTNIQTQRTFYARWNHISDTVSYLINEASVFRKLFGYGFGSSPAFIKRSPHFYGISVIDNQYITCLYEFGLISLLCLAIWAYMALVRSETEDSLSRSGSMGIVAMLFPMATYEPFTWIPVTFLLLLLSSLSLSKGKIQIKRRSVLTVFALSVSAVILIKLYPLLISWGKSVYQALGAMLTTRWIRVLPGIAALYTVALVMAIVLCVLRKKRRVLTAAILVCMVIIPAVCGQLVLRKAEADISPVMQEEAGILNIVTECANGHVFCEQYPWLYNRRFGKIRASIFDVEDILLTDENTLLVDRGRNSTVLFEKGYLFTEISDKHAIYTNDQSVIEGLESLGVCLHRYYDLERVLEENTYLQPGDYTMRLVCIPTGQDTLEKDISKDSLSETSVKMTSIQTQTELFTTKIDGSDWISGDDGEVEAELPFVITSAGNYDLSVTSHSKNSINVFYRLTPQYDMHYVFDAAGRKVKTEYFTTEGEPTLNRSGFHAILYSYNKKGYNTGQSYLDLSGEQILINEGYASYNIEYDSEGRAVKESWQGLDGKLVLNTSGFAIRESKYDADGNITEYHYKGVDEEPVFISTGFSGLHYEYDESGRRIRESYYDINEAPTIVSSGEAGRSWEYDENGDAVLEHYFGVAGDAKTVIAGYSSIRFTYDPEHRIILEEYLDAEGLPYTISDGYASVGYEYNSMGDRETLRYYDDNGNPVLTASGYAVLQRTYDRYHQVIKEAYKDEKGSPIALPSGQAEVVYKRDGAGNIISYTYLDLNGDVTTSTEGYAGLYNEYNHRKQIISTEYLDENGLTVTLPNGTAIEKYSYDEQGNQIEVDYYDISRKPVMIQDGYAQLHRKYNQLRQVVEEWYCDETGKKIEIPGGYSDKKIDYDENGEMIKESYYDIEGMIVKRRQDDKSDTGV